MPTDRLTESQPPAPGVEQEAWAQFVLEFADWETAVNVAVDHLRAELGTAQDEGDLSGWFFVRKAPCWRLRYRPAAPGARTRLLRFADHLLKAGLIADRTEGIYEPEERAFGGALAMDIAHKLFHDDSRHVLDYLRDAATAAPPLGSREVTIALCSALMRGAGLDWFEQGDVWTRVAAHRPTRTTELCSDRLKTAAHKLMTVDVSATSPLVRDGPLASIADWASEHERTGRRLAELARRGTLERGLRAVLAHHVIFHWNRLGLDYRAQATLAALTSEVIMGTQNDGESHLNGQANGHSFGPVTARTTNDTTTEATRLRNALVDQLRDQWTVRTERVEAALRAVPRHLFVPGVPLEQAYSDDAVYTKHDEAGTSISAASQPTIVAMMLEQLDVEPGQRILELGAGTGYNAALLGHLAGDAGQVIAIDVDEDIVEGARTGLQRAGAANVRAHLGDGALGHPDGAPYDRIIATVGAGDMPPAWLEQLAPHGRLVVPLRIRGSVSRSIVFERADGCWLSRSSEMCTFMPLRGTADDARRTIALNTDGSVTLQTNREQAVDAEALAGVLDRPRTETWTGVLFRGDESFEWLDLWLTNTMDHGLSRMPTDGSAIESGVVKPQFGWGAMAVPDKDNLAYLTLRPTGRADGRKAYEVGVVAHGPAGDDLAARVAEQIRIWDQDHRSRPVEFEIVPGGGREPSPDSPGRFVVDRPNTRLIVTWC